MNDSTPSNERPQPDMHQDEVALEQAGAAATAAELPQMGRKGDATAGAGTEMRYSGALQERRSPGPPARPIDYAAVARVMEQVADGKSLKAIALQPGMPSVDLLRKWREVEPDIDRSFARAKLEAADTLFEEIIDIAHTPPATVGGKVDSGHVQWQRNLVDAIKWCVSKMNHKKYSDKLDVTHDGAVAVITPADVRARLLRTPLVQRLEGAPVVEVEPTE